MSGLEATLFQPKLEEQQEHPRDLPSIFECFKQMSKRDYPRATRQQDLCMFKTPSLRCRDCTHWPPSNVAADMPIRNQRHNGHDVATEISAHADSTYLLQYILWIIFVWFHFSIKTGYLNLYLNLCNIYIIYIIIYLYAHQLTYTIHFLGSPLGHHFNEGEGMSSSLSCQRHGDWCAALATTSCSLGSDIHWCWRSGDRPSIGGAVPEVTDSWKCFADFL